MGIVQSIKRFFYKTPYRAETVQKRSFAFSSTDLATNETIFAAISMMSNAIASAPVSVAQDFRRLKPDESSIAALFEFGPNSMQSTFQFIRLMETVRNMTGAAYAIKEYGHLNEITAIWVLNSSCVEPVLEEETKELYYKIKDNGQTRYIHSEHIIGVNHITTDGYTPISPLDVLKNTIDYDREIKEFSLNQMQNGLKANMVIKLQAKLSREALDEYNEVMNSFKKNGILYVDSGKDFQELKNSSPIDPKVFEIEGITVKRVERVFNMVGKLEKNTNQLNAEDLMFLKDTILPIIRMYEQEFTKKCISIKDRYEGIKIKLSLNGFARADMQTRGDFYFKGIRSSWFSANEIRALEDMPPIPGGDTYYVSRDLCPIESIEGMRGGEENEK